MALVVRIKPRALRQIHRAAEWWSKHRLAAPGAIESDLKDVLDTLVEQPGIGSKVENAREAEIRRFYLVRTRYFIYYRIKGSFLCLLAFLSRTPTAGVMKWRRTSAQRRHWTSYPSIREGRSNEILPRTICYSTRRRTEG